MAKKDKSSTPAGSSATQLTELEIAEGAFSTFVLEDAEDTRKFRWSLGIAVTVHAILMLITFPKIYSAPKALENEQQIFVVQQVRFRPPPPPPPDYRPKLKARKVPIPDPTPDDPEPLPIDEPIPEIDMPVLDDLAIDIPDAPPVPEPDGPLHIGGNVKPPVKISSPHPRYTELARRARIEGSVIVQVIINRQGEVTSPNLLKGLSMGLDEEAIKAVKLWKFKPATLNGKPADVYFTLTVHFFLN